MSKIYKLILKEREKELSKLEKLFHDKIFYKYSNNEMYEAKTGKKHHVFFNVMGCYGLTVVDEKTYEIYKLIDGKKTSYQIYKLFKAEHKDTTYRKIVDILNKLVHQQVIYGSHRISWKIYDQDKIYQLIVWFHITNNCNLRCDYCYVHKTPDHMSDKVIKKSIDEIFDSAKEKGIKQIYIGVAGGEPLLRFSKVLEVYDLAKEKAKKTKIRFMPGIVTNGTLITEKIAEKLKEYNAKVRVSLDGYGKYNDISRHFADRTGSFKYVSKGIEILLKYGVKFDINIVITQENIISLPKFTKWLLDKKIPFQYSFCRDNPVSTHKQNLNEIEFIKYMKKAYKVIWDNLPAEKIIHNLLDRVYINLPHKRTCGFGHHYMMVNHKGEILGCPLLDNKIIGSISDKNIIDVMIEKSIMPKSINVDSIHECKNCIWKYVCCGGCPLLAYQKYGCFDKKTPMCEVHKQLIPELIQLEAERIKKYCIIPNLIVYEEKRKN